MNVVRQFHPEVRLRRLLGEAGGVTAGAAIERAGRNLETVREACLTAVGEKVERLHKLSAEGGEAALQQCYRISNEVYAEAGSFGASELSEAAHSLCTLLSLTGDRPKLGEAIALHVTTMRLLYAGGATHTPALRRAVMEQLRSLTSKVAG